MRHFAITIHRPVKIAVLTLTRVGHIWRKDQEARITCTCGWVDKAYADQAVRAANIHAEYAHGEGTHRIGYVHIGNLGK